MLHEFGAIRNMDMQALLFGKEEITVGQLDDKLAMLDRIDAALRKVMQNKFGQRATA